MAVYIHKNAKIVFFLLLVVAFVIDGCNQASETYDAQVEAAVIGNQAMAGSDWKTYGDLLHSDALAEFKTSLLPAIENLPKAAEADSIVLFGKNYHLDSLRNKTDKDFFVELMSLVSNLSPEIGLIFSTMKSDPVGAVNEKGENYYVVFKTNMVLAGREINEMNVIIVKKDSGDWKLEMSDKLKGIIMMVKSSLEQMKA